jgi:hypothetical protein
MKKGYFAVSWKRRTRAGLSYPPTDSSCISQSNIICSDSVIYKCKEWYLLSKVPETAEFGITQQLKKNQSRHCTNFLIYDWSWLSYLLYEIVCCSVECWLMVTKQWNPIWKLTFHVSAPSVPSTFLKIPTVPFYLGIKVVSAVFE